MFSKTLVQKIVRIAERLKVPPASLLAVAEVESAGVATWSVGGIPLPPIRFEGHYFYRRVPDGKLKAAVAAGLASPKPGAVKNPTSYSARYALLHRAMNIDADAAYESTSWGIGQVMGAHWKKLGYASVRDLVKAANSGVDGQVELMSRYIVMFDLGDELQQGKHQAFSDQYNGPASRKSRYGEKIAAAEARWAKVLASDLSDPVAASANRDKTVALQRDLAALGFYKGRVDGLNGQRTVSAIQAFQADNGLVVDGLAGPMVAEAIDRELAKKHRAGGDLTVKAGASVTGTGAAADVIANATSSLETVSYYSGVIRWAVVGLVVAGVVLTLFGLYKNWRGREQ